MGVACAHAHIDSDGHGHDHGFEGGWKVWLASPALRAIVVGIALSAVASVVGLIMLWPTGQGQAAAIANADELGLVTDRLSAVVAESNVGPCSYSRPDIVQECTVLTMELTEAHSAAEVGHRMVLPEINMTYDRSAAGLKVSDKVVLGYEPSTDFYFFADRDRRISLAGLTVVFAGVVLALGRVRGVAALAGMSITVAVLVGFVAPSALDGNDPILVSVVAAGVIAFVSLYLTHGFTPTTTVALAGTLAALVLTLALTWGFFEIAKFTGLATEEALILPFIARELDVGALLLGGAIIGALGALDDVTVTQVATVAELRRRRPDLATSELFSSGIRVGRDHIASTVNTLLLAYVGASMPLLMLFAVADQSLIWVANSELIAVEIGRTLCGSIGLIAAVPITTSLAASILKPEATELGTYAAEPCSEVNTADKDSATATAEVTPSAALSQGSISEDPAIKWHDFSPTDKTNKL